MDKNKIKAKLALGMPLTERERATYLLFIADENEVKEFLERYNGGRF